MKHRGTLATGLLALGILAMGETSAAAKPSPSLSEFAGAFVGGLHLVATDSDLAGRTMAVFRGSPGGKKATLTAATVIPYGSDLVAQQEEFIFGRNHFTYQQVAAGAPILGAGRCRIRGKAITFSGVASSNGIFYAIRGSVRVTKRHLVLTETLTADTNVQLFRYGLNRVR